MKNRWIAWTLIFVLLLEAAPVCANVDFSPFLTRAYAQETDPEEEVYYELSTTEEFLDFLADPEEGGCYSLLNDISLAGSRIKPVADFSGKLEGNGFCISSYTLAPDENGRAGLFRTFTGLLSGIGFQDFTLVCEGTCSYAGGFCAEMEDALFFDCTLSGSVVCSDTITGTVSAGGFAGTGSASFMECDSEVILAQGDAQEIIFGGFIGTAEDSSFINCNYAGSIAAAGVNSITAGGYVGKEISNLQIESSSCTLDAEILTGKNCFLGGFFSTNEDPFSEGTAVITDSVFYGDLKVRKTSDEKGIIWVFGSGISGVNDNRSRIVSCTMEGSISVESIQANVEIVGVQNSIETDNGISLQLSAGEQQLTCGDDGFWYGYDYSRFSVKGIENGKDCNNNAPITVQVSDLLLSGENHYLDIYCMGLDSVLRGENSGVLSLTLQDLQKEDTTSCSVLLSGVYYGEDCLNEGKLSYTASDCSDGAYITGVTYCPYGVNNGKITVFAQNSKYIYVQGVESCYQGINNGAIEAVANKTELYLYGCYNATAAANNAPITATNTNGKINITGIEGDGCDEDHYAPEAAHQCCSVNNGDLTGTTYVSGSVNITGAADGYQLINNGEITGTAEGTGGVTLTGVKEGKYILNTGCVTAEASDGGASAIGVVTDDAAQANNTARISSTSANGGVSAMEGSDTIWGGYISKYSKCSVCFSGSAYAKWSVPLSDPGSVTTIGITCDAYGSQVAACYGTITVTDADCEPQIYGNTDTGYLYYLIPSAICDTHKDRQPFFTKHLECDKCTHKFFATAKKYVSQGSAEFPEPENHVTPPAPYVGISDPEPSQLNETEISFGLYDGNSGSETNRIHSLEVSCGSYSWKRPNEVFLSDPEKTCFDSLTLKLTANVPDGMSADGKKALITAPAGFSFRSLVIETECLVSFSGNTAETTLFPIFGTDADARFEVLLYDASGFTRSFFTVPVKKREHEGLIELRNSFSKSGQAINTYSLQMDWQAFSGTSAQYSGAIAGLTSALSSAVYKYQNAETTFLNLGFSNIFRSETYKKENDQLVPDEYVDLVGSVFATKKLVLDDKVYVLVVNAVRGTVQNEWYSNMRTDNGTTVAAGFTDAFIYELDLFNRYLDSLFAKKEYLKMLITGHSRGGAVANLLGGAYNKEYRDRYARHKNTYVYTFASPNSTLQPMAYDNIHNILNYFDAVTHVPGIFGKHGVCHVYGIPDLKNKNVYDQFVSKVKQGMMQRFGMEYLGYPTFDIIAALMHYADSADMSFSDKTLLQYSNIIYCYIAMLKKRRLKTEAEEFLAWYSRNKDRTIGSVFSSVLLSSDGQDTTNDASADYVNNYVYSNHSIETYITLLDAGTPCRTVTNYKSVFSDNDFSGQFFRIKLVEKILLLAGGSTDKPTALIGVLYHFADRNQLKDLNRMIMVDCPVDLVLYDRDGEPALQVTNNEVVMESADVLCLVADTSKLIFLPDDAFELVITGYADGTMDITTVDVMDFGSAYQTVSYSDVPVVQNESSTVTVGQRASDGTAYAFSFSDALEQEPDIEVGSLPDVEPDEEMYENVCEYCLKQHKGYLGMIIYWFHRLAFILRVLYQMM
ncbi:MAG: hypothetical protein IJK02_03905 [Clostridia bacterium]|nr:hypothetical protein [Clostridia bacterium]